MAENLLKQQTRLNHKNKRRLISLQLLNKSMERDLKELRIKFNKRKKLNQQILFLKDMVVNLCLKGLFRKKNLKNNLNMNQSQIL